jgi:hypothetical protein
MAISMDKQGLRLMEVFSTSFNAFGRQPVDFIILSAVGNIPSLVLGFADVHYPGEEIVDFVCESVAYGAIIYGVTQNFAGRWVSITEAIAIAARRLWPLMRVCVAVILIGAIGSLVFARFSTWMGLLATAMYFMLAPVCIAEQVGVAAALSRILFLTKEYRWKIFGATLLVVFVELVIGTIIGVAGIVDLPIALNFAAIGGMLGVLGAFDAVLAAVFYDRLHSIKEGAHMAKIFD